MSTLVYPAAGHKARVSAGNIVGAVELESRTRCSLARSLDRRRVGLATRLRLDRPEPSDHDLEAALRVGRLTGRGWDGPCLRLAASLVQGVELIGNAVRRFGEAGLFLDA